MNNKNGGRRKKKPQDYRVIPFLNTHTKTAVSDKNVLGKR